MVSTRFVDKMPDRPRGPGFIPFDRSPLSASILFQRNFIRSFRSGERSKILVGYFSPSGRQRRREVEHERSLLWQVRHGICLKIKFSGELSGCVENEIYH